MSILSFNGNKVITTGGGGMLLTNNEKIALKYLNNCEAPHAYEFFDNNYGCLISILLWVVRREIRWHRNKEKYQKYGKIFYKRGIDFRKTFTGHHS